MPHRLTLRLSVLALVIALLPADRALAQNLHYGMNTQPDLYTTAAPMLDKLAELGAGVLRLPFGWDVIEPSCKGCFDWTATDAWRDQARRTHRTIFASLGFTPGWANGGRGFSYPPLNDQDWYDFVYAVVARYQRRHRALGHLERTQSRRLPARRRPGRLPAPRHHRDAGDSRRQPHRARARSGGQSPRALGRLVCGGDAVLRRSIRHRHRPLVSGRSAAGVRDGSSWCGRSRAAGRCGSARLA